VTLTKVAGSVEAAPPAPMTARAARTMWPIVLLIAIPTLVFVGANLFGGHLLLSGDNLIQSYPLRVLVGADLRKGIWPTWDPLIWSGTPLLAGLNAGAFYPATFLFAVFSGSQAWVMGEILIFSSVGVGTYLLLRAGGTSALASFLGAASFAFAGAVADQTAVHLDMGEGFAALPWALLAIRHIGEDARWRWAALLGVATGVLVLAGSPEAIVDVMALAFTYALVRWSLRPAAWWAFVSRGAVAAALGFGLSAVVWIPALHFIATSQRAHLTASFASEYSYPPSAILLSVIPFLEGGSRLFSQPQYFGASNLPEVALYVGILPLVAVLSMLARPWRNWPPGGERRTWYVVLVVGLVLAIGAGTPLEQLLVHIPFYGKQRDQGRNIVAVDLAACALFAWWIDAGGRRIAAKRAGVGAQGNRAGDRSAQGNGAGDRVAHDRAEASRHRSELAVALGLLGVVIVFGIWFALARTSLWRTLGAFVPSHSTVSTLWPALGLAAAIAASAAVVVWLRSRLKPAHWASLVAGFTLVDLVLFSFGTSFFSSEAFPSPTTSGALLRLTAENLSNGGRYAVFDPDLFDPLALVDAGEPNVGVVDDLPSVAGYGAIVNARYSRVSGAHERAHVSVNSLILGTLRPLELQVMLTVPEEFLIPIAFVPAPGATPRLLTEPPGVDPALPGGNVPIPQDTLPSVAQVAPHAAIRAGHQTGWFFGTTLQPQGATLLLGQPASGQRIRLGEITPAGGVDWQAPTRVAPGTRAVHFALPSSRADGIVVALLAGAPLGPVELATEAGPRSYLVDGPLADALTPNSWRQVGFANDFVVFKTRYQPVELSVRPRAGSHAAQGSARMLASSDNSATIRARANAPSFLVWSMTFDVGWHATVTGSNGVVAVVKVHRVGLLDAVAVPRGLSVVRFTYTPAGFSTGLALSLLALGALLIGALATGLLSSRRRSTRVRRPQRVPDR
jgi:hypothetical protein